METNNIGPITKNAQLNKVNAHASPATHLKEQLLIKYPAITRWIFTLG